MGCGKDRAKVEDMREDSRECHLMPLRTELEEVMKRWVLRTEGLVGGRLDRMQRYVISSWLLELDFGSGKYAGHSDSLELLE